MIRNVITLVFLVVTTSVLAQKRSLSHEDYDLWKEIEDTKISQKGKLIVSVIRTATKRGDGYIEIYNIRTKQKTTFFNGYEPSITHDERFVVFKRKPKYETTRKEKKKKVKKDQKEKDALFIYDVTTNKILDSVSRVMSYKMPDKSSDWVVIEKFKNKKLKEDKEVKDSVKPKLGKAYEQKYALIYHLTTKKKDTIYQIKDFAFSEKGDAFYYSKTTHKKSKDKKGKEAREKDIGVFKYDISSGKEMVLDSTKYLYDRLVVDKKGKYFSFMSAKDSTHVDSLEYELFLSNDKEVINLVDTSGKNLRNNWKLSDGKTSFFSENSARFYFYSKPKVTYIKDTTLLEDEIPQVDVWNWSDKMIQPEQKARFKELETKAYLSYYEVEKKSIVHLQDEIFEDIVFDKNKEKRFILGATSAPYSIERSWNLPWTRDFYVIDTYTGKKRLALTKTALQPFLSPNNKYALYYDMQEKHWFSLDLNSLEKRNLTKSLNVAFYDEDDDHPMLPYRYGFGGFDKEGNGLIYDKFDVWKVSLSGDKQPVNITGKGRQKNIVYRTLRLDSENRNVASYSNNKLLITSFDKTTKASGLYVLKGSTLIEKIKPSEFFIDEYKKAQEAEVITFQKQNFNTFQDVHYTSDNFGRITQITEVNPQKKDFKWGGAELFSWKSYDGKMLEGIIYKPDDFDPSKKYPLITYFYEKRADSYRNYYTPRPSASVVNPSYLVSNGYIMFVPDIVYEDGKPGPSAYNCVISGVEAVEKLGYIDSANMGIQGQSWGGYQVAYLITVTNKFKAAMAGAPVSNMTSAYGGIRWQSGLSRAFQYERSQSRIGKNLWDGFDLYIENSPLFGIPKIETPLLMMHNDNDGAVPYYQGIEMFMGMRRLQKPVWLLVYNDEQHNLRKEKNRQDLSIRMMQFFDHYLQGKPAPKWMTQGVSRVDKGKNFGYDLEENDIQIKNTIRSSDR
ncbi:prolyl oligopeptidase family serine peptidase [Aquimarina sp. D1M17]|uniref:alpha/beta hydrolase family protein n=1 Tax=Aquimarina acroporae TaxID=2937283 RepID=UPI0020BE22EC|nr:prolyl oligopeptidase family serine peptidase [Aquimarina acroporae]MCK8524228.1 prolyl oligopeptidase family serine peptidase [Aquimarina acroporae]